MTMDQAAVWLSGSILTMLGFIIVAIGLVVINQIFHRYWKPVTLFSKDSFSLLGGSSAHDPMQNLTQEEYDKLVEHLENNLRKTESSTNGKSQ